MPLIVGNLLNNMDANSFISREDAEAYIEPERGLKSVVKWLDLDNVAKDSSLVSASRWLATGFTWCKTDLTDAELLKVGRVAVRVAVELNNYNKYGASNETLTKKRVKADTVEVEYADAAQVYALASAGGRAWPWIDVMLKGLIVDPALGIGAMVV